MTVDRGNSGKLVDGTLLVMSSVLEMAEHTIDDLDETPHTSQYVELDGVPTDSWPSPKRQIAEFLKLDIVELISNLLVVFNGVAVVVATDAAADGPENVPLWVQCVNISLLMIYFAELCVRIYISGARFFTYGLAVADFLIIVVDVILEGINILAVSGTPTMSLVLLRIFRLVRLRRAFRLMVTFPELRVMIHGFTGAAKTIFWGAALIGVALLMWSLIMVQVVHPYNLEIAETGFYADMGCGRCERAFSSVGNTFITLTQHILAGDSWGQVAIPVIEHKPWTAVIFLGAILSVNLGLLNLILAVIVDKAHSAREQDVNHKAYIKRKEKRLAVERLKKICRAMDVDGSGTITLKELLQGYDNNREFSSILSVMDVKKEDMHIVFEVVDEHRAGEVNHEQFVNNLYRMKTSETHTLLMFMRYYVTEIQKKLGYEISLLKQLVSEFAADAPARATSWASCAEKTLAAQATTELFTTEGEEPAHTAQTLQSSTSPAPIVQIAVGLGDDSLLEVKDVAPTVKDHVASMKSNPSSLRASSSAYVPTPAAAAVETTHVNGCSEDQGLTSIRRSSGQASAGHPPEWMPEQGQLSTGYQGQTFWPAPCCSLTKASPVPTPGTLHQAGRDFNS